MPHTVRVGILISERSLGFPQQQGTGQQGCYASGTLRKQYTKSAVRKRGILLGEQGNGDYIRLSVSTLGQ